MIYEAALPV